MRNSREREPPAIAQQIRKKKRNVAMYRPSHLFIIGLYLDSICIYIYLARCTRVVYIIYNGVVSCAWYFSCLSRYSSARRKCTLDIILFPALSPFAVVAEKRNDHCQHFFFHTLYAVSYSILNKHESMIIFLKYLSRLSFSTTGRAIHEGIFSRDGVHIWQ